MFAAFFFMILSNVISQNSYVDAGDDCVSFKPGVFCPLAKSSFCF